MNYWLIKQEPSAYNWEQFVKDKKTVWNGVRNYQARNNLQAMKKGDLALFYHSVLGKEIKGVAQVVREHYPDPTTTDSRWVVVDLQPLIPLKKLVTLEIIKSTPQLQEIALIKQSRLSVMPLTKAEFKTILKMAETKLDGI